MREESVQFSLTLNLGSVSLEFKYILSSPKSYGPRCKNSQTSFAKTPWFLPVPS